MNTATDTTTAATQASSSATDQTGAASTAAQTTDQTASKQTAATSATDTGGAAASDAPWQDSLEGDLATNPLFRTYKTPSELAKAHAHLTALKGATAAELLKIPAKPQDQAPEDWAPIHKALGVPDDPKDYKIELAPEAAADAPALVETLRGLGAKAKFQPSQMAAVIETLNELGQASAKAEADQLAADTKTTAETLAREQGAAFEGNKRAIGKLMRDAIDASLGDIKDPAAKTAAREAAAADLETALGSNLTLSRILAYAVGKMAEPEAPEGGGHETGAPKAMTPAAATAAISTLYADKEKMAALNDKNHPQHGAVLKERQQLLAWQNGSGRRPDKTA
ncbi:hypothetical protein [Brevundimonas sp.]|uniref:hypothetical protein n=1 Tax=Brevundimonas sp. TaxID=1871086 RepID=UPI0028AFE7DE|nr:hypothetical protein [Brevundimonas sp.]